MADTLALKKLKTKHEVDDAMVIQHVRSYNGMENPLQESGGVETFPSLQPKHFNQGTVVNQSNDELEDGEIRDEEDVWKDGNGAGKESTLKGSEKEKKMIRDQVSQKRKLELTSDDDEDECDENGNEEEKDKAYTVKEKEDARSRREELMKQLKLVEEAINMKRRNLEGKQRT